MEFSRQDTGVGCHFLLQGIFLTQGSNPGLLHCRQIVYHLSHQGSPFLKHNQPKTILRIKRHILGWQFLLPFKGQGNLLGGVYIWVMFWRKSLELASRQVEKKRLGMWANSKQRELHEWKYRYEAVQYIQESASSSIWLMHRGHVEKRQEVELAVLVKTGSGRACTLNYCFSFILKSMCSHCKEVIWLDSYFRNFK